jgi:hypothetical protein
VLIRRDWDFLFDQLRSTHAVIDYLNRVTAMDPVPLGHEPLRYYSLAQADEEAQPEPPSPQVLGESGRPVSLPLLPKVPAGRGGTESHVIVRMILEDVATAPIGEGTEADRMTVLAEIDALP